MSQYGTVETVEIITAGTFTTASTASGHTVLPISDMSDFNEDGGQVLIGTSTTPVAYATVTSDDDNGDTITLSVATVATVGNRTPVIVYPKYQQKVAWVTIDPEIVIPADVPSGHLWADARLKETATGGQPVLVEHLPDGTWTVLELIGTPPSLDLSFGTPGTLPSTALDPTFLLTLTTGTVDGGLL